MCCEHILQVRIFGEDEFVGDESKLLVIRVAAGSQTTSIVASEKRASHLSVLDSKLHPIIYYVDSWRDYQYFCLSLRYRKMSASYYFFPGIRLETGRFKSHSFSE
jgi:hypothetical protein